MALDSWLTKVKSAISTGLESVRSTMASDAIAVTTRRKPNVGILAFEIASLISKLLHLWRFLSDANLTRFLHEAIMMEGVHKIVSDDDALLLRLASAELTETLRKVAESASTLSNRCTDPVLLHFAKSFKEFADSGLDPNNWVMSPKEMESKVKKMDRYVSSTAALFKQMEELSEAEHGLRKLLNNLPASKISIVAEAQQKILWQRQEVKSLQQTSLWKCSFDAVMLLLARSSFTVLARIKHVFVGIGHDPYPLPRSLSSSSTVFPSSDMTAKQQSVGFFESNSAMLVPPASTLGAVALALHYANLIVVIEKMIRNPKAVGSDARDDLYAMLPARVRALLRVRLRGVGWGPARDMALAAEWRAAMTQIVGWLGPVAHSTIWWQAERSFERRRAAAPPRANVLLLQTLYFANREKVEAAVAELLVGLNYFWRFEMAMSAEGLMQSTKCLDS